MAKILEKITYGKNVYTNEEISAVQKRLRITTQMSDDVRLFEKKIASVFGYKYGVMVNSGTSAIMLALRILNLKKKSEVIVPCLNFGTAISSLIFEGLKPVFVDVDKQTLQILEKDISKKITKKTKAIMIPNLIGNIPMLDVLKKIAKKNKLIFIQDSADTIGATFKGNKLGKYSDMLITSFYGSHVISCAGNGGMLLLNKKIDYLNAKTLRSWGRASSIIKDSENIKKRLNIKLDGFEYDRKFVFEKPGFNIEPSEISASFGLVQIKKLKKFTYLRNKNFFKHFFFFKKLKNYFIIPKIYENVTTNFLAYPIIIKENKYFNRRELQTFLEKSNIQTRPIFSGNILRHPAFNKLYKFKKNEFKNSDYIMKNGLLIGCHHGLKEKQIKSIHFQIKQFLKKHVG